MDIKEKIIQNLNKFGFKTINIDTKTMDYLIKIQNTIDKSTA